MSETMDPILVEAIILGAGKMLMFLHKTGRTTTTIPEEDQILKEFEEQL